MLNKRDTTSLSDLAPLVFLCFPLSRDICLLLPLVEFVCSLFTRGVVRGDPSVEEAKGDRPLGDVACGWYILN